jgi:sensor histidine kinase YesM
MKRFFYHNAFFRLLGPVIYGLLIYLLILLINNNVTQMNDLFRSEEVYICIGLTYLSFESIRAVILLLDRFLPARYTALRIPVQFIISTAVSLSIVLAGLFLYFKWMIGFSISGTQLILFSVIYLTTALLFNVLYFSNYYLQKENTLKINSEKQQRDVLEMEMMEFQNDINPDLLYEGLENVINLMYRNRDAAEEYIDHLASAYRYVLTNRQRELVPLSAELEAGRTIVHLLNEKYHNQLQLDIRLQPDDLHLQLIPGSITIVLENIIRNTIISHHEPLIIRCYMEDDEYLTIQSRLNDRLVSHTESTRSLQRLQKSYTLYSDHPLIQVKAYEENYIKLPLIRVTSESLIES